jgi:hypothetical protein
MHTFLVILACLVVALTAMPVGVWLMLILRK